MSKEAMKLALEALEMYCEHGAILRPLETRDAIKEALAKQEQEVPEGYKLVMVPNESPTDEPDWEECIRQAEVSTGLKVERHTLSIVIREVRRWLIAKQEQGSTTCDQPVAKYIGEDWNGSLVSLYEDLPLNTLLYTTPQQRKPLTREVIERDFYGRVDFVRQVEAAHGIKE